MSRLLDAIGAELAGGGFSCRSGSGGLFFIYQEYVVVLTLRNEHTIETALYHRDCFQYVGSYLAKEKRWDKGPPGHLRRNKVYREVFRSVERGCAPNSLRFITGAT